VFFITNTNYIISAFYRFFLNKNTVFIFIELFKILFLFQYSKNRAFLFQVPLCDIIFLKVFNIMGIFSLLKFLHRFPLSDIHFHDFILSHRGRFENFAGQKY